MENVSVNQILKLFLIINVRNVISTYIIVMNAPILRLALDVEKTAIFSKIKRLNHVKIINC